MLNASTEDIGPAANGLEYALDLDDAGYEGVVYFDGIATRWPGLLAEKPDHPVAKYYEEVDRRGLIGGACGYCAHAFDGADGCRAAGVDLIGGSEEHGPDVGELTRDGYALLPVG